MEEWKWPITVIVLVVCGFVGWKAYMRYQEAKDKVRIMNELKMLGLAYSNFQKANNRPPKSFDELFRAAAKQDPPLPAGARDATVIWGAGMEHLCKDGQPGMVVLGHAPAPDGKNVIVLYADGAVILEPPDKFGQTKKATPLAKP